MRAMILDIDLLSSAATTARGLAIDAVHASQSGHLGLPLGCADIGAALFGHALRHAPEHPEWPDRDRFVLSAGHGSMFLYAWLHLSGYSEMTLDEIKQFRQLHSKTPGHPEYGPVRNGVETTSGPLGQGVANAVGMALSEQMAAARFNTPEHRIFDHKVVCLAGDGCMQEGVAREALAFAGHQQLDNLILIYDANQVTLDAMANATQSDDYAREYAAIGFEVQSVDGHDIQAFWQHSTAPGLPRQANRNLSLLARSSLKASPRSKARKGDTAKAAPSLPRQLASGSDFRRSRITLRLRYANSSNAAKWH